LINNPDNAAYTNKITNAHKLKNENTAPYRTHDVIIAVIRIKTILLFILKISSPRNFDKLKDMTSFDATVRPDCDGACGTLSYHTCGSLPSCAASSDRASAADAG